MHETLFAARNFEDFQDAALQNRIPWRARFKMIALWLAMMVPMAWGVAVAVQDIRRSMTETVIGVPPDTDRRHGMLLRTIAACSFGQGIAGFRTPTARAPEADYSKPMVWLCRLGRSDACSAPLDAAVIAVDGSLQKEPYKAASNPPIDSFDVYPTVSVQPAANSEADWGLHLIDANLTMGNLLAVIGDETRTYLDASKKK